MPERSNSCPACGPRYQSRPCQPMTVGSSPGSSAPQGETGAVEIISSTPGVSAAFQRDFDRLIERSLAGPRQGLTEPPLHIGGGGRAEGVHSSAARAASRDRPRRVRATNARPRPTAAATSSRRRRLVRAAHAPGRTTPSAPGARRECFRPKSFRAQGPNRSPAPATTPADGGVGRTIPGLRPRQGGRRESSQVCQHGRDPDLDYRSAACARWRRRRVAGRSLTAGQVDGVDHPQRPAHRHVLDQVSVPDTARCPDRGR